MLCQACRNSVIKKVFVYICFIFISGVMLKKYGTERAAVDNFIRGQQHKLLEQFKKKTVAAAAKSALANYNYF